MRALALVLAVLLPGGMALPRPASADDLPFTDLVTLYHEADKKGVTEEEVRLIGEISRRAAQATAPEGDKAAQVELEEQRKVARSICRRALGDRLRVVILAGLQGYATLALPGSATDLRPYANRQASEQRPHEVRLAALAAWGAIHDPGTHPLLLDYVRLPRREQERFELALAALRALAEYRAIPPGPHRYELLDKTITTFVLLRDSATGLGGVSVDTTEWYAGLREQLLATWSALAGRTFVSLTAAQDWWRDHRREFQAGQR